VTTVVITGAGSGLGAYLSDMLTSDGFDVVATDIAGTTITLDVTSAEQCRAIAERFQPDIWINCAGVLGAGDASSQSDEIVNQVIGVNLHGTVHGSRAAMEVMQRRGTGHIINIGSLASWVPVPGECLYAATKAAVLSFTLGLASEVRMAGYRDIHLSVVCPDGMLTPMLESVLDDPAIAMSFTAFRLTTPKDVGNRVRKLIRRPRLIASVPRSRGFQVRLIGIFPGAALRLAPMFQWMGTRNQRRIRGDA
jgi:NAD(P)-dependent dehydrogenase (short-subunit alcohol dehydrogenase family)